MPGRGCGDGTGNSRGVLHLTFGQLVATCGRIGRESKTGNVEVIVVRRQEHRASRAPF